MAEKTTQKTDTAKQQDEQQQQQEAQMPELPSYDADRSTYKENPDPNPEGITPEPGPSTVQELGKPS